MEGFACGAGGIVNSVAGMAMDDRLRPGAKFSAGWAHGSSRQANGMTDGTLPGRQSQPIGRSFQHLSG